MNDKEKCRVSGISVLAAQHDDEGPNTLKSECSQYDTEKLLKMKS